MNNLEKEANNYGWRIKTNTFSDPVKANELAESAIQDFIAGAKSKYVKIEKLKFAVEQLKNIKTEGFKEAFICIQIYNSVKELENQIKELENGI